MKRTILALVAIAAFSIVGCREKSHEEVTPRSTTSGPETQVAQSHSGTALESSHAGLAPQKQEMSVPQPHRGKVVSTMNAAGYTYIEVEEKGKRLWAAVMETKVKPGDNVEFPDIPPMENFHSNTLNRTFERIVFSPILAVNGKMQTAVAQPGSASAANPHAGLKVEEAPAGGIMGKPGSMSAANPHGALMPQGMDAGAVHKGKVVTTMNAAGYTYIEVEEKGKKLWAAVKETKVKAGDNVEFPDIPPMENFHSNTLNRTFERIIFSPIIRINGKPENA